MFTKWIQIGVVALLLMPFSATAQNLKFNGFLSVSGGMLTNDDIGTYRGYDDEWSTDPDTTFGLQVSADLTDKISATGQLIARGTDDYEVDAEWAYLKFAVNENWDVKIGKLRIPFFYYSDFLEVGYAYPWITPPVRSYFIPFADFSGIDTVYSHSLGNLQSTYQFVYGRHQSTLSGIDIELKDLTGAYWTLAGDWWTARVGATANTLTVDSPQIRPLLAGIEAAGFVAVADQLRSEDDDGMFLNAAINIDYNDWIAHIEWQTSDPDKQSFVSVNTARLFMVGRRVNNLTFHVTYNEVDSNNDRDFLNAIPSGIAPGLDALKAGANAAIVESEQTDITYGVRYDFTGGTAFKFEIIDLEDDVLREDGTLVAFSFDMVF